MSQVQSFLEKLIKSIISIQNTFDKDIMLKIHQHLLQGFSFHRSKPQCLLWTINYCTPMSNMETIINTNFLRIIESPNNIIKAFYCSIFHCAFLIRNACTTQVLRESKKQSEKKRPLQIVPIIHTMTFVSFNYTSKQQVSKDISHGSVNTCQ